MINTMRAKKQKPLTNKEEINLLHRKILLVEERESMQRTMFNNLEFRFNLLPYKNIIDEILNQITKTFKELDCVKEVYYQPLDNNTIELTIIHNMQNRAKAMELCYDKFTIIENAFSHIDFNYITFHKNDVRQARLSCTRPVFLL